MKSFNPFKNEPSGGHIPFRRNEDPQTDGEDLQSVVICRRVLYANIAFFSDDFQQW
jgi:hypothetical protein